MLDCCDSLHRTGLAPSVFNYFCLVSLPYNKRVPRTVRENLLYRRVLLQKCQVDLRFRRGIMAACKEDPLFFFSAFCWCFEPRPRYIGNRLFPKKIPYVSWEHQDPIAESIFECLGRQDVGIEKSRGEGLSWIGTLFAVWDWTFNPMVSIGLISKDKDSVDSAKKDSLFWKIDSQLEWLPEWMVGVKSQDYVRTKTDSTLINLRNESSITGYAATADAASGGRCTWMLMDELAKFPRGADEDVMASTQHVTDCRIVVSTPKGASGAYYSMMNEPSDDAELRKIRVHWSQNPTKNRGLYRIINNRVVASDPENNPVPEEYLEPSQRVLDMWSRLRRKGFKLEGKLRSPWYDRECSRGRATPTNVAQELDLDYGGSAHRVITEETITRMRETVTNPIHEGDIDYFEDGRDLTFGTIDNGPVKLWIPLSHGKPPKDKYVFSADISAGLGGAMTSNSVLIGFNAAGEQVFEFSSPSTQPAQFADFSIAVCKWFHNAMLGWETGGPGNGYTKHVVDAGYQHIYYRTVKSRKRNMTKSEPGWVTNNASKEVLFSEGQNAILTEDIAIRSKQFAEECENYVRKNGVITHALIANTTDDGQGASHGDRVIAGFVGVIVRNSNPEFKIKEDAIDEDDPPSDTMAARWKLVEEANRRKRKSWDNKTLSQSIAS